MHSTLKQFKTVIAWKNWEEGNACYACWNNSTRNIFRNSSIKENSYTGKSKSKEKKETQKVKKDNKDDSSNESEQIDIQLLSDHSSDNINYSDEAEKIPTVGNCVIVTYANKKQNM